jgi:hypothetical protein
MTVTRVLIFRRVRRTQFRTQTAKLLPGLHTTAHGSRKSLTNDEVAELGVAGPNLEERDLVRL